MFLISMFLLHVLSCDFSGEFLCTSRCLRLDGSVEVVKGEMVTITKVPNTTIIADKSSLYDVSVQKGKLQVTEHCGALGNVLTCATMNRTKYRQLEEDIPNPVIQKSIFDEDCDSFTKVVREFDSKNVYQLECQRDGVRGLEASIEDGPSEEFSCTSIFLHPDQTITKSKSPYKNVVTRIGGYGGQFTKYENIDTGFHETGHCGQLPDQESLCLTTNISYYDQAEIISKMVFTGKDKYKKYVRSVTEDSLFVGCVECSSANIGIAPKVPQCNPAGNYTCSGFCVLKDGTSVSAPEFTIVEEVSPGLFYNVSSGSDSVVHDFIICVFDESMDNPALSCVMTKKSGQDVRIAAVEEVFFDEYCDSMTRIVRDLIETPVCEFRCDKD